MLVRFTLTVALTMVWGTLAQSGEVNLAGVRFPTALERQFGNTPVKMNLTGAAMRTKLFVNVYAIASYLQDGVPARNAEQLASADCPKCLQLVMLRDVGGKDIADAFFVAIRANYADPNFQTELAALHDMVKEDAVKRGDQIWLTHAPGVGLHIDLAGKSFTIRNPAFSKAIWDIYLGKNNLGEPIKRGLTSRLQ